MKQLNISKMKINNEHIIKRPYVIPACRVREMIEMVIATSPYVETGGMSSGEGNPLDPNAPFGSSSKERFYNGYSQDEY